jgi:hypothetical protein
VCAKVPREEARARVDTPSKHRHFPVPRPIAIPYKCTRRENRCYGTVTARSEYTHLTYKCSTKRDKHHTAIKSRSSVGSWHVCSL